MVDASAETNEEFLLETLDTDDGARRLGELGIGCNPGITRYMRNTLFDEKIDGTVHVALGKGFPYPGRQQRVRGALGHRQGPAHGPDHGSSWTARSSSATAPGWWTADAAGRSPLRQRPIVALVAAEIVSSLGSQMTFLALPWFVLSTTGSATKMGVVLAAELVPVAVLGIPSGTVVSRLGARRTMVLSDLARAPLLASIPLLYALGWLSFPLLLVIVALVGVFIAPYFSSQRLVLPELVGDDEHVVAQANAVLEGAQRTTSLLGPALAGLLIASFSAPDRALRRRGDVPRRVPPDRRSSCPRDRRCRRPRTAAACSPASASCCATGSCACSVSRRSSPTASVRC